MSEQNQRLETRLKRIIVFLDASAKAVAGIIALTAILTLCFPFLERSLATAAAWRFGATGWVYYEIGKDHQVTDDGQLYLLTEKRHLFEDIDWGDKLQSASNVNFRDEDDSDARIRFVVKSPNCLIVLKRGRKVEVQEALTGGWLFVGTTACGLFN